jgi:acetoin utilization deacetylase AcuC-like enzyme
MYLYYSDTFVLPLPPGHRFPMEKYARLRQRLADCGEFSPTDFLLPRAATDEELSLAHDPVYVARVARGQLDASEQREIGFPWSGEMVERSRRSVGATIAACRAACEFGIAANLAGGTHHAQFGRGGGFCVFNDAAVAARAMQLEGRARRILIVDCDVHQGDGTANIFADDESVYTFSIHGAGNYPFNKARSNLDIELDDGCGDADYLANLDQGLAAAFDASRPDLAIYLAGADPYEHDRLGRLALSMAGLAERDRRVCTASSSAGTPLAVTMAGGYARNIDDTVTIHTTTVLVAKRALESFGPFLYL